MMIAASICLLLALVAIVNIEAWRRRVSAEIVVEARRRQARELAWDAVRDLESLAERRAA